MSFKSASPDAVEEMLRNLIAGNQQTSIQISDIMSFPVITVHERTPMREAAAILRQRGVSGLPVVNDDEALVGVLSRRDFKKVRGDGRMTAPVKAFMSEKAVSMFFISSP
jgi:CBS domain-containing protein